jgi:hypothetical protein
MTKHKDKFKMFLGLINEAPRHEDIWGNVGITPPLWTSALDGGELSASRSSRFALGQRAPIPIA